MINERSASATFNIPNPFTKQSISDAQWNRLSEVDAARHLQLVVAAENATVNGTEVIVAVESEGGHAGTEEGVENDNQEVVNVADPIEVFFGHLEGAILLHADDVTIVERLEDGIRRRPD